MKKNIRKLVAIGSSIMILMPSSSMAIKYEYNNNEYKTTMSPKDTIDREGLKYISVREYGQLKNKKVEWDKDSRVLYIGTKPVASLKNNLSMREFIDEYNVYSNENKTYGSYLKGFKDQEETYKSNQDIKINVKGKEYVAKNINLDQNMYPVYNEFAKVKFSLATSKDFKVNKISNGAKVEETLRLEGGAPRIKVLKKTGKGFEYINLVSKLDYKVDKNSKNQPEKFEIKLKDVYAVELPKNAIDIEFVRNNDVVRIYEDGKKLISTNRDGKFMELINVNGKFYMPYGNIEDSLRDSLNRIAGIDGKTAMDKYGVSNYEKNLADKVQVEKAYVYNPRTENAIKIRNAVHIPDGELKLNKEISKITGYHVVGAEVFKMTGNDFRSEDKVINEKYNVGTIRSGRKLVYDSSYMFKSKGIGEIIEQSPDKARLKEYVPGNIVYFEIDVKDLDTIRFNNFNAINLEFIR